jgi:predicted DNA-binding transcriptional regulator YafY
MRYERSLAISSRHDRLIELIRTGGFSSPELAEKLKVSEQTIYRDSNFLKSTGYSIRSEKRADGWAYHLLAEPATVSNGKGSSRT